MKRHILLTLLALFTVTFANAQTDVHIVNWAYGVLIEAPDTINGCMNVHYWTTNVPCDAYTWSRNDWEGGSVNDSLILIAAEHSFTLYLTAELNGNVYRDSLCFIVKDWITPMENFYMEIDGTGHAVFSGIATAEHKSFFVYRSLDTVNWHLITQEFLSPGFWTWRDEDAHFGLDTIWNYYTEITDSCYNIFIPDLIPGLIMGTQPAPGGGWYLTMKSVLQSNKKDRDLDDYVYALFTVDQQGVRHPFEQEGNQVLLPTSTQAYLLPGRHPDAFYQGAVARLDAGKDEGMEILSYSNKVVNPLPDLDDVDDIPNPDTNTLKVWPNPNPNNGTFMVEGEGRLKVFNLLGQIFLDQDITGKTTMTLPQGVYIMKLNGQTIKLVVE